MPHATLGHWYVTVFALLLSSTVLLGDPPASPESASPKDEAEAASGAREGSPSRPAPKGSAASSASRSPAKKMTGVEEKESFSVIQIGDRQIKVVPTKEIEDVRERLEEEHAQKVEEHELAKEAALKEKKKFNEPKPKRKRLKVVASGLTTRKEIADARKAAIAEIQAREGVPEAPPKGKEEKAPRNEKASASKEKASKKEPSKGAKATRRTKS